MRLIRNCAVVLAAALLLSCSGQTPSPAVKVAGPAFELKRVDPPTLNVHPFYSQATVVSGPAKFIYIAGQVDRPVDYEWRSNRCQHDDWRGQYIGMMENVRLALEAVGADWDDVVFVRRYITDRDNWREMLDDKSNPVPNYWEGKRAPPSTMVQVVALSEPCQLMETDVFAVIPDDRQ